jgi:hypothetical protein
LVPEVVEVYWASEIDLLAYLEGPLAERLDRILEAELENDDQYTDSVFQNTGVWLEREIEKFEYEELDGKELGPEKLDEGLTTIHGTGCNAGLPVSSRNIESRNGSHGR